MKKIIIVFDQLPDKESGGLLATYVSFYQLFNKEYDIEIVSVFNCDDKNKTIFNNNVRCLSKVNIDNRFYKLKRHLKNKDFISFFYAIFSALYFFFFIPFSRIKTRKLFRSNEIVIAVSPAAAIFISKKINFILEIHINFEYFWGNNLLGKLQSSLMTKPKLTIFRNKADATKGSKYFPSTYIYNFFNSKEINQNVYYETNKNNKILFVGRLHEQKNPVRLLECAQILKEKKSDFQLDIYGTGEYENILKQEIIKRNLSLNVRLCGFTKDKNIYNQYKVLWLTSKREGFGLVIIEAKANYVPTISVNWGDAVYEVIENKKDGFIVDSNEELVEKTMYLLNNEKYLKEMSYNARENYLNKFSEVYYKNRWIEIIEDFEQKYLKKG